MSESEFQMRQSASCTMLHLGYFEFSFRLEFSISTHSRHRERPRRSPPLYTDIGLVVLAKITGKMITHNAAWREGS